MSSESSNHTISSKANTNGVLPVTAAQTAGKTVSKPSNPRLKVIIRRLAPGLTEAEFIEILGEEWALGHGKVDWVSYVPGKESKDPAKPSRPSRAYLHLTHSDHLLTLPEAVRNASFEDARNTWNNSCLIGPPSVEFASYGLIPSNKRRNDARQGTIDQDPEFMSFLESLANPVSSKDTATETTTEEERTKSEVVLTTPLVQFLKDKKANKGKEAATTVKTGKPVAVKAVSKPAKESSTSLDDTKKKGKDAKNERLVAKSTKEVVKVLSRESAKIAASTASAASSTPPAAAPEVTPKNSRAAARERGSIAIAARIIQRDLGYNPSNAHRKAKADIAAADAKTAAAAAATTPSSGEASSTQPTQSSATPTGPRGNATESRSRGRGNRGAGADSAAHKASKDAAKSNKSTASSAPITLLKKPPVDAPIQPASTPTPARSPAPAAPKIQPAPVATASTTASTSSRQRNSSTQPNPSAGAKRAFVKHANPSQGITEALLKEALEVYGATSSVEIDKRKGFAYVEFVDATGLTKAMKASPIKIANGTVQVLERKDRDNSAGGGKAAKGGAGVAENAAGGSASGGGRNGGRGARGGGGGGGGGAGAAAGSGTAGGGGRNRGRNGRGAGAAAAASSNSTSTTGKETPPAPVVKEAPSTT